MKFLRRNRLAVAVVFIAFWLMTLSPNTVHGSILSDTAYYKDAIARLQEALELARSIDDTKQRIFVLSMIGRPTTI